MDRFIPSDSSFENYRSLPNSVKIRKSMPDLYYVSTIEDRLSSSISTFTISPLPTRTSTADSVLNSSSLSIPKSSPPHYSGIIAQALGFSTKKRVLNFHSSNNRNKGAKMGRSSQSSRQFKSTKPLRAADNSPVSSTLAVMGPLLTSLSPQLVAKYLAEIPDGANEHNDIKKGEKNIKIQIPHKVLEAPGLRNDFYSNIVSWSAKTGKVAVGLGSQLFLWSEVSGPICIPIDGNLDTITSLVFSDDDLLVVGTKLGKLTVYSQEAEAILSQYECFEKAIYCICWIPKSCEYFFIGNEIGEVSLFKIAMTSDIFNLELVSTFRSHEQQICGLAISSDRNQIAVGSNNNSCTLWDITDLEAPSLKFSLPHQAAVKAIAYCPWSSSLLATGGGSKDRTLRFWHTKSGTLLGSMSTKGQVTSVIWSRSRRQIAATFGYGDLVLPLLVSVYSYPSMTPVVQVPATPNSRILSAVISPDYTTVCVGTNDETLVFYKLWPTKTGLFGDAQDGLYGSDLIELYEGIDKVAEVIR